MDYLKLDLLSALDLAVRLPGGWAMRVTNELFYRANDMCRRRAYEQRHRGQSKQQILRSQVGFQTVFASRPQPCQGCTHHHGIAYGTSWIAALC